MLFRGVYENRRVLVTGHTGFKGSWLSCFLKLLNAKVCGVALPLETDPAHSNLLALDMRSEMCDIRDPEHLQKIFAGFQPEIVFHLAAQPLVRLSYEHPAETFETNVMGTVNVLEACRKTPSVRAIVVISSDKCYENREQLWGYRENEPMGGYDPYSASKGCTELVAAAYRRSFFPLEEFGEKHHTLLATARAGNVVGGGDWAKDRLVPDLMRAAAAREIAELRNPDSVRPWQHVLEPLSGYLLLGEKLFHGDTGSAEAWNFGPEDEKTITVGEAAKQLASAWGSVRFRIATPSGDQPHEAALLRLDCAKAHARLLWHGVLSPEETFSLTADWYRAFYDSGKLLTYDQIRAYAGKAAERNLSWTK